MFENIKSNWIIIGIGIIIFYCYYDSSEKNYDDVLYWQLAPHPVVGGVCHWILMFVVFVVANSSRSSQDTDYNDDDDDDENDLFASLIECASSYYNNIKG